MQVLVTRGAGLDVHKKTVVACVMLTLLNGEVNKQVRTFATTTESLLALADWLTSQQVTHVAMEFDGNLLETRVQHSRRGVQCGAGQCSAYEGGSRAQNRCEGLGMVG